MIIKIVLTGWLIIAAMYLNYTPHSHRSHDFAGHVEYTEILYSERRFPKPLEAWEAYHPPLYYLINTLLLPVKLTPEKMALLHKGEFRIGLENHINLVQAASVVYGAISLVIVAWFLNFVTVNETIQLLTLLFIASTPRFVYMFSTYNNDSLATLLCIGITAFSYKLHLKWSWKNALILLLIATAAVYTKYTTVFCFIVICLLCSKNILKSKLPDKNHLGLIAVFVLSISLFTPWMIFHNYKHTGQLLPVMWNDKINKNYNLDKATKTLNTVFKSPFSPSQNSWGSKEWEDPWAHGYDCLTTKQHDYPAFAFVTSILGEFVFTNPSINFAWALLLIHLIAYLIAIKEIFKNNLTKLCGWFILLSHLLHIINISRITTPVYGCFLDYRYICWNWIAWACLYASALNNKNELAWILNNVFIVSIVVQIYVLATIVGTGT